MSGGPERGPWVTGFAGMTKLSAPHMLCAREPIMSPAYAAGNPRANAGGRLILKVRIRAETAQSRHFALVGLGGASPHRGESPGVNNGPDLVGDLAAGVGAGDAGHE